MKSRFLNIIAIRSRTVSVLAVTLGLFAFSTLAKAVTLTLDFADGEGTSSVDQWTGKNGGVWRNAWAIKNAVTDGSATFASTGVSNTSPLYTGGGNHLKFVMDTTAITSGSRSAAAIRKLETDVIDLARTITYSFYFRLENDPSTITASSYRGPQYAIFADTSTNGVASTGSGNTWLIQTTSTAGNSTSYWELGDGNGTGSSTLVKTTMKAEAGVTYFFTVVSDPATRTWTVSINNGSTTYDSVTAGLTLDYRSIAADNAGQWLQFAIKDLTADNTESLAYSLDHITVSQADAPVVPEPMTTALFLGAGAFLAVAIIRRRASR
ncbi:PEP-CTERM sorting domain-containing protein [Geminisphaera colitermitum]|uniref:PEP-CTERM sorting domain-containing protein n=1 Tax=Geminisphaera colitermitum TaxID=1148786 RepID=UPI000158CE19|nr:PEP-CTERM sorting domain-containing protein [Geminisphaera colitermitum]